MTLLQTESWSFRFAPELEPEPESPREPSLSLTASDGTGLLLQSLSARVVVEDPLAFTELRLVFENPEDRQLEGRFRVTLPPGASVSRFAMRLAGGWQEGEVVERQAARRAYEDFLHKRQDPALLEHEAGNEFSARVFPIEPRERKELIVSFSHELTDRGATYVLPLRGLPRLGRLDVRAIVGRASAEAALGSSLGGVTSRTQVVEVVREDWLPDVDFELKLPVAGQAGLRSGSLVVMRASPLLSEEPDEISSLLVLVDTSASRSLGLARQATLVEQLIAALARGAGAETPVRVVAFDQQVSVLFDGLAAAYGDKESGALMERMALGATALAGALRDAAALPKRVFTRALVLTDGVATAGEKQADAVLAAVKALGGVGVERLDVIAMGGLRDEAQLRRLVTSGLPRDGVVCDGERSVSEIAARLTRSTRSGLTVEVPGAAWVWPEKLDAMQPGDCALVYAEVPPAQRVRLLIDGADMLGGDAALETCDRPLLERASVKARLARYDEMLAREALDDDGRAKIQREMLTLSVRHRVLCSLTALLVLESEADYAQYGIERNALADILTVGMSGLEVVQRKALVVPPLITRRFSPAAELPWARSMSAEALGEGPPPAPSLDAESARTGAPPAMEAPAMSAPMPPPPAPMPAGMPLPQAMSGSMPMPSARPASPREERLDDADNIPNFPRESLLGRATRQVSHVVDSVLGRARRALPPSPPGVVAPTPPIAPKQQQQDAWTGRFFDAQKLLRAGKAREAVRFAIDWLQRVPGDVLALVALGDAAEAAGDHVLAMRAYGSLIDMFPSRADLRRFAGERLSLIQDERALSLAIDTFSEAVASRPDHPSSHRLLGMALVRAGRFQEAFEAIAVGQARSYPPKFPGVTRILTEDLGLVAAAWIRAEPERRAELLARLKAAGASLAVSPSVRFVLVWETDNNDVDFHIHDAKGGHAFFGQRVLQSGGELYADITQGYGPECFTIELPIKQRCYPYKLLAHYYSRGPMGYGMGSLQIVEHDGNGKLSFEERPYVVMVDSAYVELGEVSGSLAR